METETLKKELLENIKDKICGVYKITNLSTNKFYIGSSINIKKHWEKHKALLRHNKHENPKLQNYWNKYTEKDFIFEILEECDISIVRDREQYYLNTLLHADKYPEDKFFDEQGLNLTTDAHDCYLLPESISKISATLKAKYASGEINKTHTKQCYQYNRYTGELIKIWDIVNDACRYYNTPNKTTSVIHRCLWKETPSAFDSVWSYEPIEFIYARKPQKRNIYIVQNIIDKIYTFTDSTQDIEYLLKIVYNIKTTRDTISKYTKSGKIFKNEFKFYKLDAPIIYDGKPFELLGTYEALMAKTKEEILSVNA